MTRVWYITEEDLYVLIYEGEGMPRLDLGLGHILPGTYAIGESIKDAHIVEIAYGPAAKSGS